MKKVVKWGAIVVAALIVLVIAALLIIPMFIDVQKYKPEIEKRVAEATGRPFKLGGDLQLSLFPWAGVALSDLHLGNPEGFEEETFVSVKSFEVRVKLLPLLSKDLQVKRFVMEAPEIVLVRAKDGRANWEGIGQAFAGKRPKEKEEGPAVGRPPEALPIKTLVVGEFAITDGTVLWIDHRTGERREIKDFNLRLEDVSLDRPLHVLLSARLDGNPLALEGTLGPVGREPGKGTVPLDFSLKASNEVQMDIRGQVSDPVERQQFDLALEVSPFSPRKLMASLGQALPVATADPDVLKRLALKAQVRGNPRRVAVRDGRLDLDDSHLTFSLTAREFAKPDVTFDLNLDAIDLDRYLPPPEAKPEGRDEGVKGKSAAEKGTGAPAAKSPRPEPKKVDYGPLRRLVLEGTIRIGQLKVRGARIQDLHLKLSGRNGILQMDPLALRAYDGSVAGKGKLDVQDDVPKSSVELRGSGIQVGPLLHDVMEKDFLEGAMQIQASLSMTGDEAERIKQSLNGKGELRFQDGAIVGIDLPGMVRNVKATFGLGKKPEARPRTDFSELHAPFTISDGLFQTKQSALKSPLLRVLARGQADLKQETLNFRVEPKFVTTLKGQGDTMQRAGIMVPVLVSGTFSSPKFRPDLEGIMKQRIGVAVSQPSALKETLKGEGPKPEGLKQLLPGQGQRTEEGESQALEEKAKGLIKSLPLGQ